VHVQDGLPCEAAVDGYAARVVEVSVAKDEVVRGGEVDAKHLSVVLEHHALACVEENALASTLNPECHAVLAEQCLRV
jgi:hypothetical protein